MERIEAYALVIDRLREVARAYADDPQVTDGTVLEEMVRGESGSSYDITVAITQRPDGTRSLIGTIRSTNPQVFEMMQEELHLLPGADPFGMC